MDLMTATAAAATATATTATAVLPSPFAAKASTRRICNAGRELSTRSLSSLARGPFSPTSLWASPMPSRKSVKPTDHSSFRVSCKATPPDVALAEDEKVAPEEEISPLAPSTVQVQSLLLEVCDRTRIAELKLKVGAFQLHMKRNVGKAKAAPVPSRPSASAEAATVASSPAPAPAPASAPAPTTNGGSPGAAPAPSKPKNNNFASSIIPAPISKTASLFGLLEAAADQGLSFVTSPKVGVFRRARNVKGKIGKPLVEEGFTIKEGQVVGYLEQLGTQQPVESQVSGEVVQVMWQDGEAVGYGDPLVSIRPSFPGIVSRAALN